MTKGNKKFDYNVVLIVLCFFMIFFGLGLWGPKGLFVKPITEALGIERSLYSISDTMRYVATAIVSIFFGTMLNRFGTKMLVCAGFALMAVASVLYALADGLVLFYLGGLLTGVGLCWTGTSVVAYVINKTCKRNRGTVMGFILAANGIGCAVASPVISMLINDSGNPFGYRNAFYLLAAVFALMFVLFLCLFREPTEAAQSDASDSPKKSRGVAWVGIEYTQAKRKGYFYGVCVAIFLSGLILSGVSGVTLPYLSDKGLPAELVATISGVSALLLAVFKLVDGFMYDTAGLRATVTISCLSEIGVVICLLLLSNTQADMVFVWVSVLLGAIALPMQTIMVPIYANEFFGDKDYNKILGIFVAVNQIGLAVGAPFMNVFYDVQGNYRLAFLLCIPIMVVLVVLFQFVINSAKKVRQSVLQAKK